MNATRLLALCAPLCLSSASVLAQGADTKTVPVPPQMEDVKTPAPPVGAKPPLGEAATPVADPTPPPPKSAHVGAGFLAGTDSGLVHFDEPGDGRIWAAGDSFKASFGAEGATYVPFLGSHAPRNFPVRLALRAVRAGGIDLPFDANALPVRDGQRVVFDRGVVDEVYELTATSVEQIFVVDGPLAGAIEIEIEVGVDSELARSHDAGGLVLAGESGSVRYGRAFALDANAGRTELATRWHGDAIRIEVEAERVATATWPLVIDPLITTFDVDDDGLHADVTPDVAYDATTGYWMAVYEREFSATDHDVFYRLFETDGGGISLGWIDMTAAHWVGPRIANNNIDSQFLCVAAAGSATGGARSIRGRTRAATGALGSQFTISGPEVGDKHSPDVGGDPSLAAPTYYCVVWQRSASEDDDIHARLVGADSTTHGSTIFLSNSAGTQDLDPTISNSDGAGSFTTQDWNIAWTRLAGFADYDLYGAQIHWNGVVTTHPFAIDTSTISTHAPSVSTSTNDSQRSYLVAFQRQNAFGDPNTWGYVYRGSLRIESANLTTLAGAPASEAQRFPSVDCDGSLFVVADQESYLGTLDYDIYASTFHLVGSQITLAEGHRSLAFSVTPERYVEVYCAASSGGPARTTLAIWQDDTTDHVGDIEAAVYGASPFAQFCNPGVDGVQSCPCGNAPGLPNRGCNNSTSSGGAALTASGDVSIDTVRLTVAGTNPSSLCVFLQGGNLNAIGAPFGDGLQCISGSVLRLATKTAVSGSTYYPQPLDLSISQRSAQLGQPIFAGSRRYYGVFYRDASATFACTGNFNLANAVQVQW